MSLASLPTRLLIGVSGGADSTYLLHQLARQAHAAAPSEQCPLVVCHLHHGLRGAEADADAHFVQTLAARYSLPYELKQVDITACMQHSSTSSLETVAREERLRFFTEVAQRYHIHDIALAHHADDHAETVLMNICRGSHGIKGIQEKSTLKDYNLQIWHPLLHLRKADIIAWLKKEGEPWREDTTNQEGFTVRNRLRKEVFPLLNDIFQREVTPNITRSAVKDTSEELGMELITSLHLLDPQGRLFLPKLTPLSTPLQSTILHAYLKAYHLTELSSAKIDECLQLITSEQIWKVNLCTGTYLRRKEKRIFLDVCQNPPNNTTAPCML